MASKARWQVAWLPEAVRGRTTLLSCTALGTIATLLLATPARSQPAANARPSGGVVTAGSAVIGSSASTTTITQSSQRTAINWQSFDVGSQQTVDFIQPSSSSVALNRVISSNPSQIAGRIDANGQIILINQSGVIFDHGSQVNTAGLIVSAAGMSNVNFMAGNLVFDQAANPNAAVVNQGALTVKQAGLAALVAPQVVNSGVITARLGHVVLAGAKTATLDLYGDGLVSLDVNNAVTQAPTGPGGAPVTALVTNSGVIRADGGTVQLTAREADGLVQNLVQAGGTIRADSVGSRTGTVVLGGLGGSIALSGVVMADGGAPGTTGGRVQVDASQGVTLAAGSRVSASGSVGGGTVAIGTTLARAKGGPGTASALTAQTVSVAQGASIDANATGNGDGGRVTVLSSLSTSMAGNISAKGGPRGGNGGFVETSGDVLSLTGLVNASAPLGMTGTILLDPQDLVISTTEPALPGYTATPITPNATAPNVPANALPNATTNSWITPSSINGLTGAVVLQATRDLTVASPLDTTAGGTVTSLELDAGRNLTVSSSVKATDGVTLAAGLSTITGFVTSGSLAINAAVTSVNGSVTLTSGTAGSVTIAAAVSATTAAQSIGVTAGSLGITLQTGAALTAPTVTLVAGASGIALNGTSVLGETGATVDLSSTGGVSEVAGATVTAATLQSSGGISGAAATLAGTANAISGLGNFSVTGFSLSLSDTGALSVSGAVSASGGASSVTIGGAAGSTPTGITLAGTGSIVAPTVTLSAGASGFALNTGASLGQTGATVDLSSTGGIDEVTGATITAATLQSSGGISGAAADLNGTANAIGALGNFAVTGFSLSLSDTGALGVSGAVSASGGANSVTIGGAAGSTPTGITLSGSGSLAAPTVTLVAGASGIALNGTSVLGQTGATVDLTTSGGGVSEASGASIVGATLQSSGGVGGTADLVGTANTIGTLTNFTVTGGNLVLIDNTNLAVSGAVGGSSLFLDVTQAGETLSLGATVALTGSSSGKISLVADQMAATTGATLTGAGTVELAPFSAATTLTLGATGAGLSVTPTLLGSISIGSSGTLVIGRVTPVSGFGTAEADGITIGASVTLGSSIAGTLDLESTGGVSEAGTVALSVGTLTSSGGITGGAVTLTGTANAIGTLGGFAVTGNAFSLSDTGALSVSGAVSASGGASSVTIGGAAGSTPTGITLAGTGSIVAPTVTLSAGASGFALNTGASLGQTGATVDLSSTGGIDEVTGATITAATLQSSGGISGAAADLNGTANAIGALGNFAVTGFSLSLSDTGALGVSGAVSASGGANSVTIGGAAGSTPTGITLSGSGSLAAPTVTLVAGTSGIALNGTSVLGETGATVDLSSTGGVTEATGATVTAATLQSSGGISGAAATLAGTANAIPGLGNFAVTGFSLSLSDTGALSVSGAVSASGGASSVTIGGAAGSTPTGITLAGTGSIVAPTVTLSAGASGFALNTGASLGQTGATVDLSSTGGIDEVTGATITAATLQSSGGISGAAADLNGTANAIGALGNFAVTGFSLSLSDTGALGVSGAVSASGGANSVTIGGAAGSTPTGITLSGSGSLAAPTVTLVAGASGIALNGTSVLGQTGATVDLTTSGGGVSEASGASIVGATLQSSGGVGGTADLVGTANTIGTLTNFTVTGGNLVLIDNTNLAVSGAVGGSSLFLDVTQAGETLSLGATVALTGSSSGKISLVADQMAATTGATLTGAGTVELAPFSAATTLTLGATGAGLSVTPTLLGSISIGSSGTLVIGRVTPVSGFGTAEADGITIGASVTLGSSIAGTLDLESTGGVSEAGTVALSVGTLTSSGGITGGAVTLTGTANAIGTLGGFAVTGNAFSLSDTGALSVSGAVSASGGASSVTIGGAAGSTPTGVTLAGTGSIVAPTVTLSAGASGFALNTGASLGQTGATVDLSSTGGIDEVTGATITAATLQSSGGISGAAADLNGTANAIGALGNFAVTGFSLSLSDTGALGVSGAVSASGGANSVTIGGAAGSTPTGITLSGSGSLAAPTVTLVAGASGIALNGTSVLGQTGATVDLTTSGGGVSEASGASIVGATLQSSGGVGGTADLVGTANTIGTLTNFTVTGGNLVLIDNTNLAVSGAVGGSSLFLDVTQAGETLSLGATVALTGSSSGKISLVADQMAATTGATLTGAGTVELAPFSAATTLTLGATGAGLSVTPTLLGSISIGSSGTLVIGRVTPVSGFGTAEADGITIGASVTLGSSIAGTLDLESTGGISEAGTVALSVGTLTSSGGITGGAVTLTGTANAIGTLGGFAVTGNAFSLSDTGALSVSGAVSASGGASSVTIGGAAGSTPTGITLTGTGSIVAPTVTLSAGASGIALNTGASLGQTGATVDLSSTGGIDEVADATITAATLQSSGGISGAAADLNGTANAIGALGGFTVTGFSLSLSDAVTTLNVAGSVSGSGVTLRNSGGITFASGSTLSAGTSGTVELDASGGAINAAQGAITAGLLTDAVTTGGAALFTNAANAVTTLGPFAATGQVSLTDTASTLNVSGSVSGSGVTLNNPGGIIFAAGSSLSAGEGGTVELDAVGGNIDASLGAITAGVLTDTVLAATAAFTDPANAVTTLGPFAVNGPLSLTDSVPTLHLAGAVSGSQVTLSNSGGITFAAGSSLSAGNSGTVELDAAGGPINASLGAITAFVLTDAVTTGGAATFTNAANFVWTLGPFAASGQVSLTDTVATLGVIGAVSGSGVTLNNPGGIAFGGLATLSAGPGGTVELDAAAGGINASTAVITAGVLTDTVTTGGAATFTDASNAVTTLGPFAATGQLSLTDTVPTLNVTGAVSGSGVTLVNPGGITFASGSTLSARIAGTVELDASGGAINAALGGITAGVLTDTVTTGGAATFTDTANAVTTLGPFAATGQLSLTDSVPTLNVAGAVSGSGVTLNNPGGITFAAASTLSAGTSGTVELDASGGPVNASLGAITAGLLMDTVTTGGAATFTDAANAVTTLGPFAASGQLSLIDTVPVLNVTGVVSGSGVTLNNPGGITLASGSMLSAGASGTVELDASGGAINASLGAITAGVLTDTVTTGGSATFTDAANAVGTLGPFAAGTELSLTDHVATLNVAGAVSGSGVALSNTGGITFAAGSTLSAGVGGTVELDAAGGAINAVQGAITAGLLTDTVTTGGAATFTDAANAVGTLGPFAATGQLSLIDTVSTLTVTGAVVGSGVTLNNPGGITFAVGSTLSAGTSGTVELDASAGSINASLGAITAGVLTDTVATGEAATFTDAANVVTTLGPFAAGRELSLTDTVATLNVAGAVSGSGVTLNNPGGIAFAPGSTLSAGTTGTVELDAVGGPINAAQGAITAGLLTDAVATGGAATFTDAANAVGSLGPFAATGQLSLTDTVPTLTVNGAVAGSGVTLTNPGGITFAPGSRVSSRVGGTVELDASGGAIDASFGVITAGVLTDTVATGGAAMFTDAANAVGTLGPFAATGLLSLTDNVPTLTIAGAVSGAGVTLNNTGGMTFAGLSMLSAGVAGTVELDASGGAIDAALGEITAGVLTDTVTTGGAATFTDAANAVGTLGPFAATGQLSLTDTAPTLNVAGAVSGSGVTLNNPGGITFAAASTLSAGTSGTVELDASNGPINAALSAITAGVLTDTVTTGGAATFTDATNTVTTLGPFAASGQLSLTDTVTTLDTVGAVSGSGVTLTNPGGITFALASTLSAGAGGTVALNASGGAINASVGAITAGVLTDSVTTGGAATFTDTSNAVTTLGPFAATGQLSLTDNVATLRVAGVVSGSDVTLRNSGGITFLATSEISAGTAGIVELDAAGGPIDASFGVIDAGVLTDSVTTGGAATFGTANMVTTLGPFAATGLLLLVDSVPRLNVAGTVSGAGVTLSVTGGITFAAGSSLSAGTGGTVELDASAGGIDARLGAITARVLTDTATTGGAATFTDPSNEVTTLGPFGATGQLSLTDAVPTLNVAGTVSGYGVTLSNTGGITFGAGSALSAGASGTVELDATGGSINAAQGAITAAVLTDTGTTGGAATFTDAANAVTTLGPFAARGELSLIDTVPTLNVAGAVSASGVMLNNPGGITFATGSTLSAGVGETVELDAASGATNAALGVITAGVLMDTVPTGGAATFTDAANAVGTLGPFAATGLLSLTDNVPTLTIAGAVSGAGATLNNTGGMTFAALSTLSAGATGTLTLNASGGPINASLGAITAGVLTDTVTTGGAATFTDLANAVATLGPFASTGTLSLTDHTALTLTGILSAPLIVINTQTNPLTMAAGTTLVTSGTAAPNQLTITPGQVPTNPPPSNGVGAYFISGAFTQLGTGNVAPITGSANTILSLSVVDGANVTFAGLTAPTTWLILGLDAAGSKVTGTVAVKSLTVELPINSVPSDFSVTLQGTVGGVGGQEAAGEGGIIPTRGATIRFNDCPIGTVGCVLLSGVPVPAGSPLQFLTLGILVAPSDEGDLLLPLVSDEDFLTCLLRKDCN